MSKSVYKQCRDLEVGESIYIESDTDAQSKNISGRMANTAKFPKDIAGFKFSCALYTGVSRKDGSVVHLNCVTRIK